MAKPLTRLERRQRTMECIRETREREREREKLMTSMMFAGRCSPNGN